MGGAMEMDRGTSGSGVFVERGRMDAATQSGGAWGAAAAAAAGAPQRRVLFRPALAKGLPSSHRHPLPRPLNATMAGCSNTRAGPSSSLSSSSHEPLNWAPASRIGAGLSNLGNTCFLNSVLQCLTYTPPLAGYLESGQHKATCRTAGFCAMCALQEHVRQALLSSGGVVSPSNLVKNLRCISKSFRMWRQEDAHEYMRYLIEALHNCCLPPGAAANSTASQERSLIHKIFGGRLRSQVKCTLCSTCSNTYDPLLDLSLEIVRADSLTKALNRFTAVEALEGDNKYHCGHCRKKVRALKQFTIDKSPNILTVQFKRFSGTGSSGGKIDKKIEFGRTLDMKPYISNPQDSDAKYSLYAVLVHAGWSTHSGHYYCFVRTAGDMWHALDDSRVKQVSERTVLDQKAYILVYIRDSASRSSSGGEQSVPNSLPACKRLLSDGAGETADDVETSNDDLDSSGCQGSRDGGACGGHMYSNGHGRDSGVRGGTAAAPSCCPRVRPAGNSQISATGDKVDKPNGAGNQAAQSDGPVETSKKPVGIVVEANGTKVVANGEQVVSNGIKVVANGEKVVSNGTKVVVNGTKVESKASKVVKDNWNGVAESPKTVLPTSNIGAEAPSLPAETSNVPASSGVEAGTTGSSLENGLGLVEEGNKVENGGGDCSTGGDDECDDWDELHKKLNCSTPHSYMRLLYAMPHTRRYFLARTLPIQRDRKRVAGKKNPENGQREAVSNGSSSCGRDHSKRPCCAGEGAGLGKKQKVIQHRQTSPTTNGAEAGAAKGVEVNGLCNGLGSEHVLRERMEVDEACQAAGGLGSSAKDVARSVQNGNCEKKDSGRENGDAAGRAVGARQQSTGSGVAEKMLGDAVENGCRTEREHTDARAASPIPNHSSNGIRANGSSSLHSHANGLYGFEVPRWSEVESNGHGSVKDIDTLLQTDKTAVPRQDPWDEEYDRGKLKKVRNSFTSDKHAPVLEVAGMANPFQAISSAKQRPMDDMHSRGSRQAGIRSHNSEERRG